MAVTASTLRLQAQLRRDLQRITDQQTRDLVSAWADAFDEVAPDLTDVLLEMLVAGDKVTRTQLMRSTRLRRVLVVIANQLQTLADTAGVRITSDLADVIDRAGGAQASVIDSQLPRDTDLVTLDAWSRVDARQVDAVVRRSTEQITSRLQPLPAEVHDIIRRELIRGVASGSNPRATAQRMVRRTEQRFNGQLGLTRALRVARTETLDAHRAAAAIGQAQQADVLAGWSWLAKLDTRTCPSCWSQHGTLHPLEEPGPFDHQQGRCGRLPVTRPWAELGLDIAEPPSLLPDSASVFEQMPAEEQLQVLGPARYAAWRRGDYPMDAWSVRRTTDGWRDSFAVSPAPGSQSGGRSSRLVA